MADFNQFGNLVGEHLTSLPTLSNGEKRSVQLDSSGRLIVAGNFDVNLDHTAGDSVQVGDGTDVLAIFADGSITVRLSDGTNTAVVDGSGNLQVVETNSADILTSLQLLDDAVFSVSDVAGATDAGIQALAVRDDALGTLTEVDGDYTRLRTNDRGALWIVPDGDVNVTATDLDIRSLTDASDSVSIGDGTDTLGIEADGSILVRLYDSGGTGLTSTLVGADHALDVNVVSTVDGTSGTETDTVSDGGDDGLIAMTGGVDTLISLAVGAGTTYHISAFQWAASEQADFRLEVRDSGALTETIRRSLNSGATPSGEYTFPTEIEVAGAANRTLEVRVRNAGGDASGLAHAAINGFTT